MKKYIYVLGLVTFLLSTNSVLAHVMWPVDCEIVNIDPGAKKILDAVKDNYFSYSDIFIEFSLIIQLAERPETEEKGSIIQQGTSFKVEMKDQDIYCDGNDLWYHIKAKNEVQINDYEGGEDVGVISPADLLRQYDSGEFEYALLKEYQESKSSISEIEFKPNDTFSDYSKLRVKIDNDAHLIKKVIAFGKDGSRFTMKITKELYDQMYPKSVFVFDEKKHPDALIEDLRLD